MQGFDFALQVMVIGFSVVIITLAGLYGILLVFAKIFYKNDRHKVPGPFTGNNTTGEELAAEQERRKTAAIVAAVNQYIVESEGLKAGNRFKAAVQASYQSAGDSWHLVGRRGLLESRAVIENIRRKRRENL